MFPPKEFQYLAMQLQIFTHTQLHISIHARKTSYNMAIYNNTTD